LSSGVLRILKKRGLIGKKGPKASSVRSLSLSELVDTANEIEHAIKAKHQPVKDPIYSFSASLSLGGDGSVGCKHLDCRIERLNKLARFALMYSDSVYINSFFSYYTEIDDDSHIEFLKEDFYDDLLVLHEVFPLIEHGHINLFSPELDVCFSCQAEEFLGEFSSKLFSREYKRLQRAYLDKMLVTCEGEQGLYIFNYDGPSPYFDHIGASTCIGVPAELANRPRILSRIEEGRIVTLSRTLVKELGLHLDRAHNIATDVIHGIVTSGCLNTTFLTHHDLHIKFLNSLHNVPEIRKKNTISLEHLTSIVPFLEDISLKDLMKVRERENEAFILYRKALNKAIDTFCRSGSEFTEQVARELHGDVIAPSLAFLDKKVNQAKRDLVSRPLRSLVGVVGAISFGILTGLIPPDMSNIAKAIGLVKFGADVIDQTMAVGDKENRIATDKFYFLWKVRNKVK